MKLLNKSISLYILYATVLLLVAIPVLYFAIQSRVVEEVDESLVEQKDKIISKLEKTDTINLVPWLQNIEPGITLIPAITENSKPDKFYTITSFDKIVKEKSHYRILETNSNLHGKPYTLQIKNSLLDSEDLIESIVKIVTFLLLLIIIGLVLINQGLSKKLWKPFYNTIYQLNDFKIETNENIQFEKTGIKEFADLNKAISTLTSRNKEVYQSQKEFTENASHEMQTPLAIFQSKVELLMQTNPLSAEQALLIEELTNASQRMNRVNKNLLLLTKIENNQFIDKEHISINECIKKFIEQYGMQEDKKGINIQFFQTDELPIEANKTLIEILISNLLSNAIKHNVPDGDISITCKGREIVIENTGKPVSLDTGKLFQRFQKQTTDSNSIGLGLQIAKKIADLYNFKIEYQFVNNRHHFVLYT